MINPYIRVAMLSTLNSGTVLGPRVIYDYELLYLAEGKFKLTYGGREYLCKKGDIILYRPGVRHTMDIKYGDIFQPHIHFDLTYTANSKSIPVSFKDIYAFSDSERKNIRTDIFKEYPILPFITVSDRERFLQLFFDVVSGRLSALEKKAAMINILNIIIKENFPQAEKSNRSSLADAVKDYIDSGLGLNMGLDDFEKQFVCDKFCLEKQFKSRFNISLIAYRNRVRMETARQMLKSNSVTVVAETVGYQSIYSFSRAYKSVFGVSPSYDN